MSKAEREAEALNNLAEHKLFLQAYLETLRRAYWNDQGVLLWGYLVAAHAPPRTGKYYPPANLYLDRITSKQIATIAYSAGQFYEPTNRDIGAIFLRDCELEHAPKDPRVFIEPRDDMGGLHLLLAVRDRGAVAALPDMTSSAWTAVRAHANDEMTHAAIASLVHEARDVASDRGWEATQGPAVAMAAVAATTMIRHSGSVAELFPDVAPTKPRCRRVAEAWVIAVKQAVEDGKRLPSVKTWWTPNEKFLEVDIAGSIAKLWPSRDAKWLVNITELVASGLRQMDGWGVSLRANRAPVAVVHRELLLDEPGSAAR